jgi:hypothetical protein
VVIPHQIITYLSVFLGSLTVKTPIAGAHRGADRRDHWANLKDLFININPLKVADCYFVHMHRRIDSSSSRSDPSANGYIDLDYSARLHLALQRRCTTAADALRRPGSASACAAMSARSSDEFDYFNFARRLGGPPATTLTSREGSAARR